jgi:putative redox protein
MATARPVTADLVWTEQLQLRATSGSNTFIVDGDSAAGPSSVQLLAISLAACMTMDVLDILRKGRHPVRGCRSSLEGGRASEAPRRLLSVTLQITIDGDVPAAAVERAIALSRDKYCSVWHSLRQDITLATGFEIRK